MRLGLSEFPLSDLRPRLCPPELPEEREENLPGPEQLSIL